MRRLSLPLLAVLLLPWAPGGVARAEDRTLASLDAVLEAVRSKHGVPALGGAVVTSRGLVAIGAVGVRAVHQEARVTTQDLWHIGSCAKSMTATLIARLVERKVLAWETTLAQGLPDLAAKMQPAWRGVTLDLLLRNRGGAPGALDADGLWAHPGPAVAARRRLCEAVLARPPSTTPGTTYEYANAGFAIAGHVAETVTGKAYEDLLRDELGAPLGMASLGFGAPGTAAQLDQPRGHVERDGRLVPIAPGPGADNPAAITPAGRMHLSLEDWGRYVSLHLAGRQAGATQLLLAPGTLAYLQSPLPGQTYALGWGLGERAWGGGPVLTHAGSNTMWYAVVWMAPRKDFAVLVTCNVAGERGPKATDEAAGALIQWFLARPAGRPGK